MIFQKEECIEKPHPGGDECCVLWVCKDEEDKATCFDIDCGDYSSCDHQLKQCVCDRGYKKDDGGCVRSPQDETNIKLLQITPNSIQVGVLSLKNQTGRLIIFLSLVH